MKDIKRYLYEHLVDEANDATVKELEKKLDKVEKKADDAQQQADDAQKQADDANKEASKAKQSITDEKSFKAYAENKFKKVFGDKLDTDKMNQIVDGIIDKYGKDGNWGQAVGVLNKSFGK